MDDLRLRFQNFDRAPVPDLWSEITDRAATAQKADPAPIVVRLRRNEQPKGASVIVAAAGAVLLIALVIGGWAATRNDLVSPSASPMSASPSPASPTQLVVQPLTSPETPTATPSATSTGSPSSGLPSATQSVDGHIDCAADPSDYPSGYAIYHVDVIDSTGLAHTCKRSKYWFADWSKEPGPAHAVLFGHDVLMVGWYGPNCDRGASITIDRQGRALVVHIIQRSNGECFAGTAPTYELIELEPNSVSATSATLERVPGSPSETPEYFATQ